MKFSFILATYGRSEIIRGLLRSLQGQDYQNFEVLVVDQNSHNEVEKICNEFSGLNINYLKSDIPGLSKARNIGLKNMTGDVVSFPDDDCWYPPGLLSEVQKYFEENPDTPLVSTATRDPETQELLSYTPIKVKTEITPRNIFHTITSIGLFINYSAIVAFNAYDTRFDERLGLGAEFTSSEEMDFALQFIKNGVKGAYVPDIFVYHPYFKEIYDESYFGKIKNNSRGHGAFLKKNMSITHPNSIINVAEFVFGRPAAGLILSLFSFDSKRIKKYTRILTSRIEGFLKY